MGNNPPIPDNFTYPFPAETNGHWMGTLLCAVYCRLITDTWRGLQSPRAHAGALLYLHFAYAISCRIVYRVFVFVLYSLVVHLFFHLLRLIYAAAMPILSWRGLTDVFAISHYSIARAFRKHLHQRSKEGARFFLPRTYEPRTLRFG